MSHENEMYGMTEAEMQSHFIDHALSSGMTVLGMMSDAQQEMEFAGDTDDHEARNAMLERARQTLNRAKWLAHKLLPQDEHGRLL